MRRDAAALSDSDIRMSVSWRTQEETKQCQVSRLMKKRDAWYFWLPQAPSDRTWCHDAITMFVSSLYLIVASMEGTLIGSDTKAPSGITLLSLPL